MSARSAALIAPPASAPVAGRRERNKRAVRERIRTAAMTLVQRDGIDGTTIGAICRRADIARKTFYNHYASKHELLLDICRSHLLQPTDELVRATATSGAPLAEQLETVFCALRERAMTAGRLERGLIDYMVGSFSTNRSEGTDQLTFLNRCYRRLFESASNELRPGLDAQFCAEITVGMINMLTLNWLHNEAYDIDYNYRQMLNYLRYSMLAQSPAGVRPPLEEAVQ